VTKEELKAQVMERIHGEDGYGLRHEAEARLAHLSKTIRQHGNVDETLAACEALRPIARAVMEKL